MMSLRISAGRSFLKSSRERIVVAHRVYPTSSLPESSPIALSALLRFSCGLLLKFPAASLQLLANRPAVS
jgi:hypothetical protein